METDDRIARIRARLLELPEPAGDLSQYSVDMPIHVGDDARLTKHAAVLIALVQRDADISVLYTERASGMRVHSGQVAFPGGKADPTDRDIAHTALREAEEEVALVADDAQIIGYLPNFFAQSNYLITPVVARVQPRTPFVPNPGEVESIFELPLRHIANGASYQSEILGRNGYQFHTWRMAHEGPTVWGMTAYLTRRFRDTALHEGEDW